MESIVISVICKSEVTKLQCGILLWCSWTVSVQTGDLISNICHFLNYYCLSSFLNKYYTYVENVI